jgi:3-hydroxyisobutyrate dehydrogenase-like beta-hydroxyacid dehydrogenase
MTMNTGQAFLRTLGIPSQAVKSVGLIGAGRMGMPLVGHMARKGFNVVVYDVDGKKRAGVEAVGGRWAQDLRQLGEESQVILVCVGYDKELRELLAPAGALGKLPEGTIVAILSTVHPRTVVELSKAAAERGVHVVDSTMCRGGKAADEGTLLAFVGGDAEVVARLQPVIACYSADIVHTGPVGTAQVAKAANNMVMWSCLIATHEALALAKRFGLDPEELREALKMSSADNYVLRNWGVNTMAWAEDDMEIVQQMAAERGLGLPQAGLNREICRTLKPKRFKLDEYGV